MKNKTAIYLPNKVRNLLITYLQNDKITTDDLYTIINILKYAETEWETEVFMYGLAEVYPVFKDYTQYLEGTQKISFEQEIKNIIPALITKDPLLATQVMKSAQEIGMTKEKLLAQYPQLQEYVK